MLCVFPQTFTISSNFLSSSPVIAIITSDGPTKSSPSNSPRSLDWKSFLYSSLEYLRTEKSDAKQLVEYAKKMDLVKWEPTADNYIRIQQMYRSIELLQINITQAMNNTEVLTDLMFLSLHYCSKPYMFPLLGIQHKKRNNYIFFQPLLHTLS